MCDYIADADFTVKNKSFLQPKRTTFCILLQKLQFELFEFVWYMFKTGQHGDEVLLHHSMEVCITWGIGAFLCAVCMLSHLCMGSLQVLQLTPAVQRHACGG